MKEWKKISLFVCVFAFAREFRPIEPFFTAYLTSPALNFTLTEISQDIYSIGAYSCFVLIIIVFLITDYVKYKPILLIDGLCGLVTYINIIGTPGILRMQIGQVFYGFFFSSEVAYFGYLYAMTEDKRYYQRITGQARAACLSGKFISSLLSQSISLINGGSVPFLALIYMSSFGMLFCAVWAILMPSVKHSVYFHTMNSKCIDQSVAKSSTSHPPNNIEENSPKKIQEGNQEKKTEVQKRENVNLKRAFLHLWNDFKQSYSDPYVVKLCFWWALAFGAYVQVYTYINVLYTYVLNLNNDGDFTLYNGAAESLNTLIGAISAYSIGRLELNWYNVGDAFFAIGSILAGIVLLCCYYSKNLWFIYTFYIIYGCLYQTMLTIAESEVAKRLGKDSYGLVFGFNSFIALFLHTLMTYGMVQGHIISVTVAQQFIIYAGYYTFLGLLFIGSLVCHFFIKKDKMVEC